ncbi:hypothetical protein BDF19DRAFT_420703 [Syncephalis fuscata]|nr:hypothetical protein BDF19DRAFT_420703 [Syncephalis fuscata]
MAERRTRRKRKTAEISNAHYVGYVEDGESVEAIMKKFEELERLQEEFAATAGSTTMTTALGMSDPVTDVEDPMSLDPETADMIAAITASEDAIGTGFTQEQLEEVFKRTSAFTVRAAQRRTHEDGDMLDELDLLRMDMEGSEFDGDYEENDDYLFMDEDYWDEVFGPAALARRPRPARRTGGQGSSGNNGGGGNGRMMDRDSVLQRYRTMQVRVQDQQGNYHLVKKKYYRPKLPTYIRIPKPIPATWAHRIITLEEYEQSVSDGYRYHQVSNVLDVNTDMLGNGYHAIYMDPPLLLPNEPATPGKLTVEQFSTLKVEQLIRYGFLFIWAEKELLAQVVRVAMKWGFKYVENFCWIKKTPDNRIVKQSSAHFARSKATLLIFRKEGGEIDLRHQRSPDCVFDFIKPYKEGDLTEEKPAFTYTMMETMLPGACYSEHDEVTGMVGTRLLELWARKEPRLRRRGWTMVAQE